MEYSEEPRLVFSRLAERDYCKFYNLEMASYSEDAAFYQSYLKPTDAVLELGCGSGRLTRLLSESCSNIIGLDLSPVMIELANQQPKDNVSYHLVDMTTFSFPQLFDCIIIPYNTLNLLGSAQKIADCLQLCRKHLKEAGTLLLHLYHPDEKILKATDSKIFQFKVMDEHDGSKVIKETLLSYCYKTQELTLEERYRVRPSQLNKQKRELKHSLTLYASGLSKWQELLNCAGFSTINHWGSFTLSPFCAATDNILLINAS